MARDPSNPDENFEINQRRKLVDQWASLSQEARDNYQSRAPEGPEGGASWFPSQLKEAYKPQNHINSGFCNLVVEQPLTSRNRALWTKISILLYRLDEEGGRCHNFGDDPVVMYPNPAGQGPIMPENFYAHCFIESADFSHMAMTSQGTVVFLSWGEARYLLTR